MEALIKEIELRHRYLSPDDNSKAKLNSIYFGGGTPSLLTQDELKSIFNAIEKHFQISDAAEITLEANPDDLTKEYLSFLKDTPVNRLSIGVQSFFDEDLKKMNRAHNAGEAKSAIENAIEAGFKNITIDLMYALPGLTSEKWIENLQTAFSYPINHLSAYCLTVEEQTALQIMINKNKVADVDENLSATQFEILMEQTALHNFEQYEISNFAKNENYAVHNSSYWLGEKYLGIGPSAHSYNGTSRQWNVEDNEAYITALKTGTPFSETEELDEHKKYNEYILTHLRTRWGVSENYVREYFNEKIQHYFLQNIDRLMIKGWIEVRNESIVLTNAAKFIADDVISSLFYS